MKKGLNNAIFGILAQIITVLVGFVLPKLIITTYGSEVNGLLSSSNQILMYLGLFEAGIGQATIQALYKPLVEDDKNEVNSVLSATRRFYNKTGRYFFGAIIIAALIYGFSVETILSKSTVVGVVFLSGIGSVLNYWGFGKYKAYLQANGESYVANNIATLAFVVSSAGKVFFILQGYSILAVQSMQLVYYCIQTIGIWGYIKIKHKWINIKAKPNLEAISQKNAVLFHQVSGLIFANTDMLILTFFCGLSSVSLYYMYNLVFSTIMNLIITVVASIVYIFGKLYFKDKDKYDKYHDLFETSYICIGMIIFSTIYICVIPFMKLYTKDFTDLNYINSYLPILFLFVQFLNVARGAANNLISIVGDFAETQNRACVEMIINIVSSLILVKIYGIYGVILGTILALLYRTNDMIIYANHKILKRKAIKSYRTIILNIAITAFIILINEKWIEFTPSNYGQLIVFAMGVGIVNLLIYVSMNGMSAWRTFVECYKECKLKQ